MMEIKQDDVIITEEDAKKMASDLAVSKLQFSFISIHVHNV